MRRVAVPLLALALVCGCDPAASSDAARPTPTATDEPAALSGEVLQFRRDAEARVVQVRLTSARDDLVVESAELDVDGFRPAPSYEGTTTLHANRPLDLRMTLTSPDCGAQPGEITARVTVADEPDPLVVPLDDGGLLHRLYEKECADDALREQVGIEVVSLTETEVPEGPALRATCG
jgi:hypothetical protein